MSDDNKVRCVEQTIKNHERECPSTIACNEPNQVVCSNSNKCVNSEIECPKLMECPENRPFLCSPDECMPDSTFCPKRTSCGQGKSMCRDALCRSNCS